MALAPHMEIESWSRTNRDWLRWKYQQVSYRDIDDILDELEEKREQAAEPKPKKAAVEKPRKIAKPKPEKKPKKVAKPEKAKPGPKPRKPKKVPVTRKTSGRLDLEFKFKLKTSIRKPKAEKAKQLTQNRWKVPPLELSKEDIEHAEYRMRDGNLKGKTSYSDKRRAETPADHKWCSWKDHYVPLNMYGSQKSKCKACASLYAKLKREGYV